MGIQEKKNPKKFPRKIHTKIPRKKLERIPGGYPKRFMQMMPWSMQRGILERFPEAIPRSVPGEKLQWISEFLSTILGESILKIPEPIPAKGFKRKLKRDFQMKSLG